MCLYLLYLLGLQFIWKTLEPNIHSITEIKASLDFLQSLSKSYVYSGSCSDCEIHY